MTFRTWPVSLAAGFLAVFTNVSCSTSPSGSADSDRPGTSGFYWSSAENAYKKGDYAKANEQLSKAVASKGEYGEKAKLMSLVVNAGVVRGYRDLADAYEAGARANIPARDDYRRRMSTARNAASESAMQLAEAVHRFVDKDKTEKFPVPFGFPKGSASEPQQSVKLTKGMSLQPGDHDELRQLFLQRGVVQVAKGLIPEQGGGDVNRDALLMALGRELHDAADIYSSKKLDHPQRAKALCTEALEAVTKASESKDRKVLADKIRGTLSKIKVAS